MKYQVLRLDKSPYLDGNFSVLEKKAIEQDGLELVPNVYELNSECRYFLISNTHTDFNRIPEIVLKRTELLIHPNSGYDNINESFLEKNPPPIIIGNPIRAGAVTEFILSAILKHFTPIDHHIYWKGMRKWDRRLLEEQKVFVYGAGNIGHKVIQTLKNLCKEVHYFDPFSEFLPPVENLKMEQIETADILILCSELNDQTKNFLDADKINLLKQNVLIINAARGELIDEEALLKFLEKNAEAFAYLDVFKNEPFEPGFGNHLKNLNKTSHIAGVYHELQHRMIDFEKEVIHNYIDAKKKNNLDLFWNKYSHLNYSDIRLKRGY